MIRRSTLVVVVAVALGGCRASTSAPRATGVAPGAMPAPAAAFSARGDARNAHDTAPVFQYQGQKIRLARRYEDYDVYKNDPDNVAPEDRDRLRKLVETAPVPEHCTSLEEVVHVLEGLAFPGYGTNGFGEQGAADPLRVIGGAVEVPETETSRVVVYLRDDRGYRLVDDTVLPDLVLEAKVQEGKVTYRSLGGRVIAERRMRPPPTP